MERLFYGSVETQQALLDAVRRQRREVPQAAPLAGPVARNDKLEGSGAARTRRHRAGAQRRTGAEGWPKPAVRRVRCLPRREASHGEPRAHRRVRRRAVGDREGPARRRPAVNHHARDDRRLPGEAKARQGQQPHGQYGRGHAAQGPEALRPLGAGCRTTSRC